MEGKKARKVEGKDTAKSHHLKRKGNFILLIKAPRPRKFSHRKPFQLPIRRKKITSEEH